MIQFHVYPEGKKRIVTFSYDDGHENDARLVRLFNQYGVKGTFHLNGGTKNDGGMENTDLPKLLKARYQGHEISCHTMSHGWPARMPCQSLIAEITENRRFLEKAAGYPAIGMSYPSGDYDEDVKTAMKMCGIVYSRTGKKTMDFGLPDDFLEWHPTCHHRQALELCDRFLANLDSEWERPLFYIFGHSHEFHTEEDWNLMESILKKLSGNEKIWYATSIEIYRYMTAQRSLEISVDETCFYNPTAVTVWVEKDKKQIIRIPAGETVVLK
ncbi:MAG: polysaccharide deacetylase family protein [Lachnospiraceae bacterium]|nr:polysaccharide deacetylase family protein [Lachnospiraceae bacterium]